MDLDKIMSQLDSLANKLGEVERNMPVKKSIKAKKEWVVAYNELDELTDQINQMEGKRKNLRSKMWAMIQDDLKDYASAMRWNKARTEIEILAEEDDRSEVKGVPSPFMKKQ